MGAFDNLLDNFSAKDLKSRVTGVIIMGFAVCIFAGIAMYFLLISQQEVAVSGMGRWVDVDKSILAVSLEQDSLRLFGDRDIVTARATDPTTGTAEITANVLAINPAAPSVEIDASALPQAFSALDKFDVKLILIDKPMWQMLWGGG